MKMKHLKTFESFKTNETMDMMFMPVDPIKGAADVYADAYDEIKSYVKGKIDQFEEKVEEVADAIIEKLDVKKTINQVESYFGKSIDELTYEDIKLKLAKANESFIDRYDAADPYGGDSEGLETSFNENEKAMQLSTIAYNKSIEEKKTEDDKKELEKMDRKQRVGLHDQWL